VRRSWIHCEAQPQPGDARPPLLTFTLRASATKSFQSRLRQELRDAQHQVRRQLLKELHWIFDRLPWFACAKNGRRWCQPSSAGGDTLSFAVTAAPLRFGQLRPPLIRCLPRLHRVPHISIQDSPCGVCASWCVPVLRPVALSQ
jgi:hypothetical protein